LYNSEEMVWKSCRREFPAAGKYVYLNNAAMSPLSSTARDGAAEALRIHLEEGALGFDRLMEGVAEARQAAADLLCASSGEIAFTSNTTRGLLLAAGLIPWRKGDNIVMPSIEFPANVYPWLALEERGVETRMVEPVNGKVTAEMLIRSCNERTRAITVSYVQFSNGYRVEMEKLGRFCRPEGIFLCVDAIQAAGALKIDLSRYGPDFLSAGGHKWLLALPGAGIFYCRKELVEDSPPPNPGWTGVTDPMNFLDYNFEYTGEACKLEEGALNMAGIFALRNSVKRFLEIGMERVEERILTITRALADGLKRRGFEITSPLGEGERSGIICFRHSEWSSEEIYGNLTGGGAVVSLREGNVRISPHIYNNQEDIDRFFSILEN